MLVRDKKISLRHLVHFPAQYKLQTLKWKKCRGGCAEKKTSTNQKQNQSSSPWVSSIWAAICWLGLGYAGKVGDNSGADFALTNTEYYFQDWCSNLVHGQEVKFLLELIWYLELPPLGIQGLDLGLFKSLGWSSLKNLTWHFVHSERSPWQR